MTSVVALQHGCDAGAQGRYRSACPVEVPAVVILVETEWCQEGRFGDLQVSQLLDQAA